MWERSAVSRVRGALGLQSALTRCKYRSFSLIAEKNLNQKDPHPPLRVDLSHKGRGESIYASNATFSAR
jgi:hypothetical protein